MKKNYFGGQIYTESTLTNLTADLDSVFKKGGIDVKTSARISNGKLVVSIPLAVPGMTQDTIPITIQSLIIGRDNIPNLPFGSLTDPTVTTDLASIDELYREAAREAGLRRYGHVRSISLGKSGIEIIVG